MRERPGTPIDRYESGGRIVAWFVVIGCHLGLVVLQRLVLPSRDATAVARTGPRPIELVLLPPPRPLAPRPPAPPPAIVPSRRHAGTEATMSPNAHVVQAPSPVAGQPGENLVARTPNPLANEADAVGDGGFRARLDAARRVGAVRGVPGSDRPVVGGIHLVDPTSQGVAAAVRTVQRAFGIPSSHCVDVAAWRQLSPRELHARHMSRADVDRIDEKYACNEPLGLRF
jgi:hypothetical protein